MSTSPIATPMIFLRVGWMDRYEGLSVQDKITGGGGFVTQHGYGHEIFNFQPFEGRVFGYVQPPASGHNRAKGAGINLDRLAKERCGDSISDVLAVWVANSPDIGSCIVGWYSHATVYRYWQRPPIGANRKYAGEEFGYYVSAEEKDSVRLERNKRLFSIPRGKGGMGQANVWYADDPKQHRKIRADVLRYIETRQPPSPPKDGGGHTPRQLDPFLRQQIERAAVKTTTEYFDQLGYEVDSVEKDNVGWDLNATYGKRKLKLEVKGLSGSSIQVELTPNEYDKMKVHSDSYQVCVVNNALTSPELAIFAYSHDSQQWEDDRGRVLQVDEVVAARCKSSEVT